MTIVNKGFRGRRTESARELPPGQHLTADFPVLQAGPTPRIDLDNWRFTIRDERGAQHGWTWAQLKLLPSERLTVDIHCVTTWSKLDTKWEGVSLDTLFESDRHHRRIRTGPFLRRLHHQHPGGRSSRRQGLDRLRLPRRTA